ncbi:MAG: hypothetical protein LC708_01905, partial [Actinobacteria bacterium]|nr:hypothetical protein [Actinomycetota bacterium]
AVADTPAEDPLVRARGAAAGVSFVGEVELRWNDSRGTHTDRLAVRGAGGSIEVTGANTVMASGDRARFVRHGDGDWDLLWPASSATGARPDPSLKYDTAEVGDAVVASRPATVVEVRRHEALLQRLALDTATGVLLRREQMGPGGETVRSVAFTAFQVTGAASPLRSPVGRTDRVAESVPADAVSTPFSAPERLSDGYSRVGVFREDGVVHVLYSDGLYDLSVFEQRGRLVRRDLPPDGRQVTVGNRPGWVYTWQGGHVLLWHAGRTVFTLVSDAPLEHLLGAAGSLPVRTSGASLADRLRRAAASLVTP